MGTQRQVALAVTGATVLSVVAVVVFDGGPGELVFMLLLLVPFALALRHVAVAARQARQEGREVRRLLAADPGRVAAEAVAAERRRLAVDIQTAVRASVTQMRALASVAAAELPRDPRVALEEIAQHGRHAMTDLRRLLGLLREAPDPEPHGDVPAAGPSRRIRRSDVAIWVVAVLDPFLWIIGDANRIAGTPVTVVGLALSGTVAGTALLRTVAPGVGAVTAAGLMAVGTALDRPVGNGGGLSAIFLLGGLVWACASTESSRRWAVAGPVALTAAVAHRHSSYEPENLPIMLVILGTALVAGLGSRVVHRRADRAASAAGSRRAELSEAAEEALMAERRTVARDLHDGVSGGVGVIVMQAGAAAALWESDPARSRHALDVVVATCDTTLLELDGLLVELDRRDGEPLAGDAAGLPPGGHALPVPRGPQDLASLVERMRAAGLDVTVTLDLPPRPPPHPPGWSVAYRVVQESLTNVLRHAPGAHVTLEVRDTGDHLDVDVADDGPGSSSTSLRGYGLVGLSERVEQVGGTLAAGAGPDGGFRVRARIPLHPPSRPVGAARAVVAAPPARAPERAPERR
jgi:signal transduction histidine kinase